MSYDQTIRDGTRYARMFSAALEPVDIARAAYAAQAALGLKRDAMLGPITRKALKVAGADLPGLHAEEPHTMPETIDGLDVTVARTAEDGTFVVTIHDDDS